jgi:hypothetical protein
LITAGLAITVPPVATPYALTESVGDAVPVTANVPLEVNV